jgi:hypothetical protein
MDKVELSIGLVNTILQYLGTKPFQEVAPLIDAIQKQAQTQNIAPDQHVVIPA